MRTTATTLKPLRPPLGRAFVHHEALFVWPDHVVTGQNVSTAGGTFEGGTELRGVRVRG